MTHWHTISHLPEDEPNAQNQAAYAQTQLLAGASPDARYIYDVIWAANEACFVLTLMEVNAEWGFVEQEYRLYPTTRQALLQAINEYQTAPDKVLTELSFRQPEKKETL